MMPGSMREQLENPTKFPELLAQHWAWYRELSATGRDYSGNGMPMLLKSAEILAWAQLNRLTLMPWEYRLIRRLDTEEVAAARKPSAA